MPSYNFCKILALACALQAASRRSDIEDVVEELESTDTEDSGAASTQVSSTRFSSPPAAMSTTSVDDRKIRCNCEELESRNWKGEASLDYAQLFQFRPSEEWDIDPVTNAHVKRFIKECLLIRNSEWPKCQKRRRWFPGVLKNADAGAIKEVFAHAAADLLGRVVKVLKSSAVMNNDKFQDVSLPTDDVSLLELSEKMHSEAEFESEYILKTYSRELAIAASYLAATEQACEWVQENSNPNPPIRAETVLELFRHHVRHFGHSGTGEILSELADTFTAAFASNSAAIKVDAHNFVKQSLLDDSRS